MRLIDADRLIDDLSDLKRSPWANDMWMTEQRKLGISEAIDMIQSIVRVDSQTEDAVQVTRCKDCKWCRTFYHGETMPFSYECAKLWLTGIGVNDFCSKAERKEE